jgi:hypothetical protein
MGRVGYEMRPSHCHECKRGGQWLHLLIVLREAWNHFGGTKDTVRGRGQERSRERSRERSNHGVYNLDKTVSLGFPKVLRVRG